jgi:hypothetical protein
MDFLTGFCIIRRRMLLCSPRTLKAIPGAAFADWKRLEFFNFLIDNAHPIHGSARDDNAKKSISINLNIT